MGKFNRGHKSIELPVSDQVSTDAVASVADP